MNTHYLALQSTPSHIEIGLFRDSSLIKLVTQDKMNASKDFLPLLDHLLKESGVALSECAFIAVNKGPGFFTTLRTIIAFANGLSFATGIPIIGVDCLQTSLQEFSDHTWPHTVFLMDACAQDVYYIYHHPKTAQIEKGYKNIKALLEDIAQSANSIVRFIGHGTTIYRSFIIERLGKLAYIPEINPEQCSLPAIAQVALKEWKDTHTGVTQLLPLYIKRHPLDTGV